MSDWAGGCSAASRRLAFRPASNAAAVRASSASSSIPAAAAVELTMCAPRRRRLCHQRRRPVRAAVPGMGRRRHLGSAFSHPEGRPVPRRGSVGERCRAAPGAVEPSRTRRSSSRARIRTRVGKRCARWRASQAASSERRGTTSSAPRTFGTVRCAISCCRSRSCCWSCTWPRSADGDCCCSPRRAAGWEPSGCHGYVVRGRVHGRGRRLRPRIRRAPRLKRHRLGHRQSRRRRHWRGPKQGRVIGWDVERARETTTDLINQAQAERADGYWVTMNTMTR